LREYEESISQIADLFLARSMAGVSPDARWLRRLVARERERTTTRTRA